MDRLQYKCHQFKFCLPQVLKSQHFQAELAVSQVAAPATPKSATPCYVYIYIYIYLDTTFFKRILEASIGAHCEKMLESEPGEGLLLSSLTHTKPGSQNFNISWDTSQKLQGTTPSWEVLSALSALTGPQNELLAVRHPAPKKLISLRRHKVAEATIEHLGFVGLPFGGGGASLELLQKPDLQVNLASW